MNTNPDKHDIPDSSDTIFNIPKFEYVYELQQYIRDNDVVVTSVSRMNCSSGVMNLCDLNNNLGARIDGLWSGYYTTKFNSNMSDTEFKDWITPKVLSYINEMDGSTSMLKIRASMASLIRALMSSMAPSGSASWPIPKYFFLST